MKSSKTIDEKHTEFLIKFAKNKEEVIPNLKTEIENLQLKLKNTKKNIDEYMSIKDKIRDHKREIKRLESEEKHYYLENSKYIFSYFEQKKDISTGGSANTNVLNSFFKIQEKKVETPSEKCPKKIYQAYWKNVTNDYIDMQDYIVSSDRCEVCNIGEMIPQDEEGILICNHSECGKFISYIVDSAKPVNKEPPNEVSYTAYIRLNHFKEILRNSKPKKLLKSQMR